MSHENVEIVRSVYSAWSDGDLDALLAVCDAGVELVTSGAFPDLAPVYRGHDGLRTFWQSMRASHGSRFTSTRSASSRAKIARPWPYVSGRRARAAA
jgi:ketosteroid isomerase-like protein